MMVTTINENSSAIFMISLTDMNGNTITPMTAAWQLMKLDGTVINNRTFALGSFTETTVSITGDDTALDDTGAVERIFAVQGTYLSDDHGILDFTAEIMFTICNLYSQS